MDLSEVVAITGLPGLFKIAGRKNDGVIATSLVDDKTQFVPARTHLSTPLDKITIYTTDDTPDDTVELKKVLASIKKHEAAHAVPDGKDEKALKTWMEKILPTYDKEKVHVSDMKKLAKWYGILNAKQLIEELTAEKPAEGEREKNEEGAAEKTEVVAKKESKPKKIQSNNSSKAGSKPSNAVKKITTPRKAT